MPTVLTTSTQHADLKHCDSLAFFTTQHLRPSDHTRAFLSTRATRCRGGLLQGRYAGCSRPFRAGLTLHTLFVHALHVQGRPHRTLGAAAAFWHATMRGQARVAAVHHGPSVRTDGPTGRPGECCANGWCTCMDRALRTARRFAASGVRAYATMRARCSNARGGALAHRCKMG